MVWHPVLQPAFLITNSTLGAVSTHQRTCWPAASAAKSSKPVVRPVVAATTPCAVSLVTSPAQPCTTPTTHHRVPNTIATTPTSASAHPPTESTALSPHHPFATCQRSPTPRPSTLSARARPVSPQVQEAHQLPSAQFPPAPMSLWSQTPPRARPLSL